jgi:hypothetical protein
MDGAQSDLRTGLPWQMLEIHEPVRLSIVVEAEAELLGRLLRQSPALKRLVDHRWIFLAALNPSCNALVELDSAGSRPYAPEQALRARRGRSSHYYEGRRGHLPFAVVASDRGASA